MEEKVQERDFEQEVRELYEEHPELRGEELPQMVVDACIGGKRLREAYGEHVQAQIGKNNESAARRAPVSGVTRGGSVSAKPEDAFLRGFNGAW